MKHQLLEVQEASYTGYGGNSDTEAGPSRGKNIFSSCEMSTFLRENCQLLFCFTPLHFRTKMTLKFKIETHHVGTEPSLDAQLHLGR